MNPAADNKDMGIVYNEVAMQRATNASLDLLAEKFALHGIDQS